MREELIKKLKALRHEKGWSIAELSKRMGFSSQMGYANIELGKTKVTLEHLEALSAVFHLSVAELLGFDAPASQQEIEELKTRIADLEDRLRDKERIIRLFEGRQG